MYVQVDKDNVLTELNAGAELFCVDFRTYRVMWCGDMTLNGVKSFLGNDHVLFFKRVVGE